MDQFNIQQTIENLKVKFSIVCCMPNWSLPPPFIGDKSYNQEEKDSYLEWKTKEIQLPFPSNKEIRPPSFSHKEMDFFLS